MSPTREITLPTIPGDGVGPELVGAACRCLDAVGRVSNLKFNYVECAAGHSAYVKGGDSLPEATISTMKSAPATLLGALSTKDCPAPSPMGRLRKALGLFADIRHCFSVPGSPRSGVDLVLVRECSEGFLPDRNMYMGTGEFMPTPDVVLSVRVITRDKSAQIASVAYEYAKKHGRKKVTVGDKSVVFTLGCGLFRDVVFEQGRFNPEIQTEEEFVDNLARNLTSNPECYDLIVTTNLFGDILAEVATAQVGNLVPIINASKSTALFYPAHGALKPLAGKEQVNPLAMLYTVSTMLHWLELHQAGSILDRALSAYHDPVLGSSLSLPAKTTTSEVVQAIISYIGSKKP